MEIDNGHYGEFVLLSNGRKYPSTSSSSSHSTSHTYDDLNVQESRQSTTPTMMPPPPPPPPLLSTQRNHKEAPLWKLSIDLIHTFKRINQVYYQQKRKNLKNSVSSTHQKQQPKSTVGEQRGVKIHRCHLDPTNNNNKSINAIVKSTAEPLTSDLAEDLSKEWGIQIGDLLHHRYGVQHLLGRGSFGLVLGAVDITANHTNPKGIPVALKVIQLKPAYIRQAMIEIQLLECVSRLQQRIQIDPTRASYTNDSSPTTCGAAHIVRFYGHFQLSRRPCLVFEQLSYNLYDLLLKTHLKGVSLNLTKKFGQQLCAALAFLGRPDCQIIHCDIKPENIVLVNPKRTWIKLVDFGSSCFRSEKMHAYIQSRYYRAPEVMLGLEYDCSIDMWSTACVLFEMHSGRPLFAGKHETDQMMRIVEFLGVPTAHMLLRAKKTMQYFESEQYAAGGVFQPKHHFRLGQSGKIPYHPPGSASLELTLRTVRQCRLAEGGSIGFGDVGHAVEDYDRFIDFLKKILMYDPDRRLNALAAMSHAFLKPNTTEERMHVNVQRDSDHHLYVNQAVLDAHHANSKSTTTPMECDDFSSSSSS